MRQPPDPTYPQTGSGTGTNHAPSDCFLTNYIEDLQFQKGSVMSSLGYPPFEILHTVAISQALGAENPFAY